MLWDFVKRYYIDSIVYKTGYNPVNTLTWAFLLLASIYVLYRFLRKRLRFDERFVYSNIPFVVLGSSLRVVEDAGFLKPPISYLFMSPFIYLVVFSIAFPSLILSLKIRREKYWLHHLLLGSLLAVTLIIFLFANLRVKNLQVFPISMGLALIFTALFYVISKKIGFWNRLNATVFFAHLFDASATFYGVTYLGYWELHVLPRFLIDKFGAWILIPTKFTVFLILLYVLDRERDENLKNFVKFVLIVLGLAPALRDSLRMFFGV
jgi:uncharacterized membrane protein